LLHKNFGMWKNTCCSCFFQQVLFTQSVFVSTHIIDSDFVLHRYCKILSELFVYLKNLKELSVIKLDTSDIELHKFPEWYELVLWKCRSFVMKLHGRNMCRFCWQKLGPNTWQGMSDGTKPILCDAHFTLCEDLCHMFQKNLLIHHVRVLVPLILWWETFNKFSQATFLSWSVLQNIQYALSCRYYNF